jgi:hypothetical protein
MSFEIALEVVSAARFARQGLDATALETTPPPAPVDVSTPPRAPLRTTAAALGPRLQHRLEFPIHSCPVYDPYQSPHGFLSAAPRRAGRSSTPAVCRRFTPTYPRPHLYIVALNRILRIDTLSSHSCCCQAQTASLGRVVLRYPGLRSKRRQKVFHQRSAAADAWAILGLIAH